MAGDVHPTPHPHVLVLQLTGEHRLHVLGAVQDEVPAGLGDLAVLHQPRDTRAVVREPEVQQVVRPGGVLGELAAGELGLDLGRTMDELVDLLSQEPHRPFLLLDDVLEVADLELEVLDGLACHLSFHLCAAQIQGLW